ncbi:MAG: VUT family protein [Pseudomonadota bacterium]
MRGILIGILAMAVVVTASNILVQYPVGNWLTWGAFTYPLAFLVTDLANRWFGVRAAQRVVLAGFALAVVLSVWLATPRIAIASGTAFLVAQMLDVAVFHRLRAGRWWRAPLVSSTLGSAVDTVLFFSLAFAASFAVLGPNEDWALEAVPLLGVGPVAPLWMSLALGDFGVKLGMALAALAPFGLAVWLRPGLARA